ncbi:MAG: hypothetical protein QOJ25_2377 [Solirubrobacteraceae bacterium]|jgi:hypothetical protein|nr:hypothetical protein [Solirubrobacteraceae bacterium]
MDGTTTTTSTEPDGEKVASSTPSSTPSPEPQLLTTAVGDTCANCGARMAGDQRYCVECGERRGKSRYTMPTTAAGAPAMAAGQRPTRWGWMSSNASLILGVGVLLLAMGVGVLIGRDSVGSQRAAGPSRIVIQGSTGGAAAAAAPTTATTTPSTAAGTGSSKSKSTSSSKSKAPSVTAASKLPPAAKKIPKNLQSKVATLGSKCAGGGKFTGTFFGSGGTSNGCTK